MALTITDESNVTSTSSTATLTTSGNVDASVGDWLVAIIAADNAEASGGSSLTGVSDSQSNTWTQRVHITNDPGATLAGATLGIFTAVITSALSSGTVTASFSPNTTAKVMQVYRVQPGAGETIQFVAADTTGSFSSGTTHSAATVSVANGNTIFGAAAIETNAAVTGDSDTTNGNWSSVLTRLANIGTFTSMTGSSQYKTVSATGNQSWACTLGVSRVGASSYLVIGPVKKVIADAGSYALTGTAATLKAARKVVAATGGYVITGATAALKHGWKVAAAAGSYAISGQAAALLQTRKVAAQAGSYAIAGSSASLIHGWKIVGGAGAYNFTGQDATLLLSANKIVTADPGAYALTGQAASLKQARLVTATSGSYSITGQAASLLLGRKVTAEGGGYAVTGSDVALTITAPPPAIISRPRGGPWPVPHDAEAEFLRRQREWEEDLRRTIDDAWARANGEIPPPEPEPIVIPDLTQINSALAAQANALDQQRVDAFISAEQQRLEDEAVAFLLLS